MAEVPKAGQYVRMTVTNVNAPRSVTRNVNTVRSFPVMGLHPNDRSVVKFEVLPQVFFRAWKSRSSQRSLKWAWTTKILAGWCRK